MSFWRRREQAEGVTAVVGVVRDDSLTLLRGSSGVQGTPVIQGEAVVRWDEETLLTDLLEQRLGWQRGERVAIAGPTPPLVGSAVAVVVPRHEEGQVLIRDVREVLHVAQWKAADTARELTATYFGCALEDVETFEMSLEQWRETSEHIAVTLLQLCVPRWGRRERSLDVSGVLPSAEAVLLPVVLAAGVGTKDTAEGILHTEDDLTVLLVRRQNILSHVRSFQCGIRTMTEHIQDILGCSPREAEVLLTLAPGKVLSERNQRLLQRVLRDLLPLWAGMFQVLGTDLPPDERPQRLLVTGLYPKLIARFFCRPLFLERCLRPQGRIGFLPAAEEDAVGVRSSLTAALQLILTPGTSARPPRQLRGIPLRTTPPPSRASLGVLIRG